MEFLALVGIVILFAPIVVLFVNVARISKLTHRVDELERELKKLRARPAGAEVAAPEPAHPSKPIPAEPSHRFREEQETLEEAFRAAMREQGEVATEISIEGRPPLEEAATLEADAGPGRAHTGEGATTTGTPLRPAPKPRPARKPSRTTKEWESLVGGKLLNRIGALALVIGIGFFLNYAFDNNWISEPVRVSIGGAIGIALLLIGERFNRKKLQVFAQGLIGAGIAVLYLSVFASFNYYHIVSQTVAFAMMSAVTALTFFLAFRYDSLAVSLLGWAGGFLTPFLLSTGQANAVGLFTYILLLDIGLLAALVRKDSWVVLEPLTLLATYGIYLLWHVKFYTPSDLPTAALFVSLFWLLFHALDIVHLVKPETPHALVRRLVALLNAGFFYSIIHVIVYGRHPELMGAVALGIGAVYFLTYMALRRRGTFTAQDQARYVLLSILLLVIATTVQFRNSPFIAVTLWSVEALIAAWCGARWKMGYVWKGALLLFAVTIARLLATDGALNYLPMASFTPLFNLRALAFASLAISLALSAPIIRRLENPSAGKLGDLLHYTWCILGFLLLSVETIDLFAWLMTTAGTRGIASIRLEFYQVLTLPVVWTIYAVALLHAGMSRRVRPLVISGICAALLGAIVVSLVGFQFDPIQIYVPLLNWRAAAMAAVAIGLLLNARRLHPAEGSPASHTLTRTALYAALGLTTFMLVTSETRDFFQQDLVTAGGSALTGLEYQQSLALAVAWIFYSVVLSALGVWRKSTPAITSGLFVGFIAALTAIYNGIEFQPIESFTPVVNFRAIALAAVTGGLFLHTWWLHRRTVEFAGLRNLRTTLRITIILVAFVLLTGETRDYFQHRIALARAATGADMKVELNQLENLEQLLLSGAWLIYSVVLMVLGIIRRMQTLRLAAIILFGITILKIFLYDLSFLDTLYRIFSFIGLGLILLGASYLYTRFKTVIFGEETAKDAAEVKVGGTGG
jgi:uncharacterized membrane protein